jgi:glycerophosphoryl diester phosphodiesterase
VQERFRDPTRFWSELPGGADAGSGIEERVVVTLESYEAVELCFVQSADQEVLARVRALNAIIPLSAISKAGPLATALPAPGEAEAFCAAVDLLREAELTQIRGAGLGCHVWTAEEPALTDRLVGWRVDGILTGRPGLLRARVGRL